jgi:hypothetical protein
LQKNVGTENIAKLKGVNIGGLNYCERKKIKRDPRAVFFKEPPYREP